MGFRSMDTSKGIYLWRPIKARVIIVTPEHTKFLLKASFKFPIRNIDWTEQFEFQHATSHGKFAKIWFLDTSMAQRVLRRNDKYRWRRLKDLSWNYRLGRKLLASNWRKWLIRLFKWDWYFIFRCFVYSSWTQELCGYRELTHQRLLLGPAHFRPSLRPSRLPASGWASGWCTTPVSAINRGRFLLCLTQLKS